MGVWVNVDLIYSTFLRMEAFQKENFSNQLDKWEVNIHSHTLTLAYLYTHINTMTYIHTHTLTLFNSFNFTYSDFR